MITINGTLIHGLMTNDQGFLGLILRIQNIPKAVAVTLRIKLLSPFGRIGGTDL
jgi:hypothetical protein